jgi:hypothetical protein
LADASTDPGVRHLEKASAGRECFPGSQYGV